MAIEPQRPPALSAEEREAMKLEFGSLREEILKRLELRNQMLFATLTGAAALISVGVTTPSVALVYPPIAALLATLWAQNEIRVREMANYIRERFESGAFPGIHFQTYLQEHGRSVSVLGTPFVILSGGGVFLVTEAIAIAVALTSMAHADQVREVLLVLDVAAMAVTIVLVVYTNRFWNR
ncbi:MAG TPA: hypothetical protein VGZ22_22445 [Isosphaeraceae bacterium]|jgi:hypothetical protein|nr:hypothetical protein [Isosphaeraceae bacterium]